MTPEGRTYAGPVTDRPLSLLYVCTANICRSAFAHLLSRHLLDGRDDVEVSSAGTRGYIDAPVDGPIAAELRARGVDPSPFRSRPLTMAMVGAADLVLTAETSHRQYILDERPELFRRVLTIGQAARMLEQVGGEVTGRPVLDALRRAFTVPDPADDVADPYRRGPEAAAAAANRLDGHVRRIVRAVAGDTMEVS